MIMNKCFKFIVEKLWEWDAFREAVVNEIKKAPIDFLWKNFTLLKSEVKGYTVLHKIDQMVPWLFTSENEVREQVAAWDKVIADMKTEEPIKKKRNRKKQ